MKRAVVALLLGLGASLWAVSPALAQDMEFGLDEAGEGEGEGEAEAGAEGEAEADAEAEGEGEAGAEGEGEGEGAPEGEAGEGLGGDVIGDLAGPDEMAEGGGRSQDAPRATETAEEIYAVQQIFALRLNRVELSPSVAFTVNDPYVNRIGLGVGLNYWWTNVLAVGVNFLWYEGFQNNSDLNFNVRRSTRLAVPITKWQLGTHLNFTYVPLYGKFTAFNEFIFQWDAYIIGGVGFMRTKPIPIIDPEVRSFNYEMRVAFNAGLGIRIFLTRFLSLFTEFRDYIYLEKLENRQVALGAARFDEGTWLSGNELTNNVSVHFGLTVFFPFTFEYKLPK